MENIDLAVIKEYKVINELMRSLKDRKEMIQEYVTEYLNNNNLIETEEYEGYKLKLVPKFSYTLDADLLEEELPEEIYKRIRKHSIELKKARNEFLDGNIDIDLLIRAESEEYTEAFTLIKVSDNGKSKHSLPFWKKEEDN